MLLNYKLITAFIVGSILAVYIYRKKEKTNYLVVLLFLSILPLVSLLRPGSYESGDLSLNVYKTMALDYSLKDGVFPANWAGILNATYGYPMFNFAYPLPYYCSWLIHLFGFSFVDSIKLYIAFTYMLSGISMFFFLKTFLRPFYAFVGGIFYLYAPYHLVDMHFRVDIGEITAMIFVPLIFLWGTKLLQKSHPVYAVFFALSLCGLILSHQAVSLTAIPIFMVYIFLFAFIQKYSLTSLLLLGLSILLGIGLSSFYLLPVLFELQYTVQSYGQVVSFQPFWEFIYSPWRYGFLFQGPKGELSFIIGYVHLLLIGISLYILWKKKVIYPYKFLLLFSLFAFITLFLLMQSFSEPLWYLIPLIKNFQFSYRLLAVIIFLAAIIAAITTIYLSKKLVYLLLFIAIISTYPNWANRQNVPEHTDEYFVKKLPYSTYEGEGLTPAAPKWVDPQNPWFKTPPKDHLEVVVGNARVEEILRKTNLHIYKINAQTPAMLLENTVYFPGWTVYVSKPLHSAGEYVRQEYWRTDIHIVNEPGKKGLMHFVVPKGNSIVKVEYEFTAPRAYGFAITLLSLIGIGVLASIEQKDYSLRFARANWIKKLVNNFHV